MTISNTEELRAIYGWPKGRAKDKVLYQLEKHAKHFIACSPFLVLSTFDRSGKVDASPRGGKPGFVKIINDQTLIIPDAKGNNRVDSLMNIVDTGAVGCLFLIPGIDETLRINGRGLITTDATTLHLFSEEQHPPKACLKIGIEEVFLHCAKALMRSELWKDTYRIDRPGFPTIGTMLSDQLGTKTIPSESQEEMVERYKKDL
ncbi:MAG: pyridoxamine 5'-phosphate oxidase family protein [Saprospiraceae bacterium]|nr:pyridoxamine 5'-phosphate oxidase family protein [Saprospiraceae bacterium]